MEKFNHGKNWLQEGLQYGPAKLDNKLFKNVKDIWESYKVHHISYEKMENEIVHRKKNFNYRQNLEKYLPEKYTFTFTICNSNNVTQLQHWANVQGAKNLLNHKKRSTT